MYKKYIKRGGKVFGPYYYESYRDKEGNIKTRYVENPAGHYKKLTKKTGFALLFVCFLAVLILAVVLVKTPEINSKAHITGKTISNIALSFYSSLYRILGSVVEQPVQELEAAGEIQELAEG